MTWLPKKRYGPAEEIRNKTIDECEKAFMQSIPSYDELVKIIYDDNNVGELEENYIPWIQQRFITGEKVVKPLPRRCG